MGAWRAMTRLRPERVLEQLRPRLRRILRRHRIPPQDAEDLLQTAVLLAIRSWAEIEAPDRWLLVTLKNLCIIYWRTRRREKKGFVSLDATWADRLPEPPAGQIEREQRILLGALARRLTPTYRRVVLLRYQMGMDKGEVAAATGLSPKSIRKTARRAVMLMRRAGKAAVPRRGQRAIAIVASPPPRSSPAAMAPQAGPIVPGGQPQQQRSRLLC
jgi:RNA polymerase sigma factor (sigma-70 family)